MELKIDSEQIKDLVSEALLKSLDTETRNILIRDALKHLLEPSPDRRGKSRLEEAFHHAVERHAERICREMLEKDLAVLAGIQQLCADAAHRMLADETREKLIVSLADTMRKALTGDRY